MSNGKHNSKRRMKELKPWTLPKSIFIDSWSQTRNNSQTRPGGNEVSSNGSSRLCSVESASPARENTPGPTVEEFYQEFRPTLFYDWWLHMNQQLPQQTNPRDLPGSSQGRKMWNPSSIPLNLYICPPLIIPQLVQPISHSVPGLNNFEGYPACFYQSPQQAFFSLPLFSGFNYADIPSTSKVYIEHKGTQITQGTSSTQTIENESIRQTENVDSINQITPINSSLKLKAQNNDKLKTSNSIQKHSFDKVKIEDTPQDSESEEEDECEIDFEF